MKLKFFHDAGHGWLEVPLDQLAGFQPSRFSYRTDTHAYLEEDCDAPRWERHTYGTVGDLQVKRVDQGNNSPIRNYRRFD